MVSTFSTLHFLNSSSESRWLINQLTQEVIDAIHLVSEDNFLDRNPNSMLLIGHRLASSPKEEGQKPIFLNQKIFQLYTRCEICCHPYSREIQFFSCYLGKTYSFLICTQCLQREISILLEKKCNMLKNGIIRMAELSNQLPECIIITKNIKEGFCLSQPDNLPTGNSRTYRFPEPITTLIDIDEAPQWFSLVRDNEAADDNAFFAYLAISEYLSNRYPYTPDNRSQIGGYPAHTSSSSESDLNIFTSKDFIAKLDVNALFGPHKIYPECGRSIAELFFFYTKPNVSIQLLLK